MSTVSYNYIYIAKLEATIFMCPGDNNKSTAAITHTKSQNK